MSELWDVWQVTQKRQSRRALLIDAVTRKSWTAPALTDFADSFSGRLAGFRPGTRIAFCLPNGAEWMAFFLALQKNDLVAVPLDPGQPLEGCFDTAWRIGAEALYADEILHVLEDAKTRRSPFALIKMTSGSSHVPKAIECTSGHLLADGRNIIRTMGIRSTDRNLASIPFGHSYGLGNLVMPLLIQGTSVVCAAEFLPQQLAEWMRRHRVTVLPSVPAIFRVLAALPGKSRLGQLRTPISAGTVLSPAVAEAFFARYGVKVHNFYGASETGGICYDRTGNASLRGVSIGKPLANVKVVIAKGRITVSSTAVATRTGRWRLNDRGEWTPGGELVLLGRLGQEANIGGKKVHPLEVERVLRSLPGVTDSLVWQMQAQGRDLLAAAVETRQTRAALERALTERLPAWKFPKIFILAEELPRTARGKLDTAALRAMAAR